MHPEMTEELRLLRQNAPWIDNVLDDPNLDEWEKAEIAQDEIDAYNRPINMPVMLLVLGNLAFWSIQLYYLFRFWKEIVQWLIGTLA